jgi:isocitrate/isopropylmalate dehydrogenase
MQLVLNPWQFDMIVTTNLLATSCPTRLPDW